MDAQIDQASKDPSDLFIGQTDGSFVEGAEDAGIVDFERARGAAVVDLNLDGMLDLVVVHRRANVTVWRNVGRGTRSNPSDGSLDRRQVAAARTERRRDRRVVRSEAGDRTTEREITIGGGHVSGDLGWFTPASGRRARPRSGALARRQCQPVDDDER